MATTSYSEQLEAFRKSDAVREQLVVQVLQEYEDLKCKIAEITDDYRNEVESRRMWQAKASKCEKSLSEALTQQKQVASTSNFAVVLIDGDGAIFTDHLYRMGKDGGAEAAHQLNTQVKKHLKTIYPDSNVEDWNVVVQVVLNLTGLATKLQSCGIIMSGNELLAFGRQFGFAQPLFSFVDVGGGKERADHKLREHLRLYMRIAQCKHVFFAPCHDTGYLPVLESYRREHANRMTLIETRPAEPGFLELGIEKIQMPEIFRSDNLPNGPPIKSIPPLPLDAANTPIRSPTCAKSPQAKRLPVRLPSSIPVNPATFVPKVPSPAPSAESNGSTLSSWATVGKSGAPAKMISIAPKKPVIRRHIIANAYNERVDPELPRTDAAAEGRFSERTKALGKHCNAHHLMGKCERGEYCDYVHGEKITGGERLVLMHKARSLSCPQKYQCMDPGCPYGHHCKFGKMCFVDRCYFSDTHDMDLEPAKRIFEDGSEEWLPAYLEKVR